MGHIDIKDSTKYCSLTKLKKIFIHDSSITLECFFKLKNNSIN